MAGHTVPPSAGRVAGFPELSVDNVKEVPLPAVEGAANGSAIAPTAKRQQERQQRQYRRHCFYEVLQFNTADETSLCYY